MSNEVKINITTGGIQRARSALGRIDSSIDKIRKSVFSMRSLLTAGAGGFLLKSAITEAFDFEESYTKVSTLVDDVGGSFEAAKPKIEAFAIKFGQSTNTLNEAYFDLISSGSSVAESLEKIDASATLAVGGFTKIGTSTKALITVYDAFKDQLEGAADAADFLFAVQKQGRVDVADVARTIGDTASNAAALNIDLRELGGAYALISRSGIGAEKTVVQLDQLFRAFTKSTDDAKEAARKYGVELNVASIANGRMFETLVKLKDASNEELAIIFAEQTALKGYNNIMLRRAEIEEIVLGIQDRRGAAEEAMAKVTEKNFFKFKQFLQVLASIKRDIGAKLLPSLTSGTTKFQEFFNAMKETGGFDVFSQALGTIKQDLKTIGKFIAQLPDLFKIATLGATIFMSRIGRAAFLFLGLESAIRNANLIWKLFLEYGSRAVLFIGETINKIIDKVNKISGLEIGKVDLSGQEALVDIYTRQTIEAEKAAAKNKALITLILEGAEGVEKAFSKIGDAKFDTTEAMLENVGKGTKKIQDNVKAGGEKTVEEWRTALEKFEVVTDAEMEKAALTALTNFIKIENSGQLTGQRLAAVWNDQVGPQLEGVFDRLGTKTQNLVRNNNKRFEEMANSGMYSMTKLEEHTRDAITSMKGPFTDFFDTANKGFLNLQSLVGNVMNVIRRKAAEAMADKALKFLTSALFGATTGGGGGFLSSLFGKRPHGGGHVGSLPTQQIAVVPTFHTGGLADDETFAKLKKKEYVFNEKVTNDLGVNRLNRINSGNYSDFQGGGGGLTVLAPITLNINAIDPQSGMAFMSKPEHLEMIGGYIRQVMVGNGGKDLGL